MKEDDEHVRFLNQNNEEDSEDNGLHLNEDDEHAQFLNQNIDDVDLTEFNEHPLGGRDTESPHYADDDATRLRWS